MRKRFAPKTNKPKGEKGLKNKQVDDLPQHDDKNMVMTQESGMQVNPKEREGIQPMKGEETVPMAVNTDENMQAMNAEHKKDKEAKLSGEPQGNVQMVEDPLKEETE